MNLKEQAVAERRRLSFAKILLIAIALAMGAVGIAWYQSVNLSYERLIFNAVTGPTISPLPNATQTCSAANGSCGIENNGMGSHWVTACIVGGTVTGYKMELEGSNDTANPPGNWMQVSEADTSLTGTAGCSVLEAAGYFQYLRLNLITFAGTGSPKLTAWYAGVGTAIPGGGIIKGSKSSQPVVFTPGIPFNSGTVKSANVTVTVPASPIVLTGFSLSNPNAGNVFVSIQPNSGSNVIVMLPANGTRDRTFTPGITLNGPVVVNCSTSAVTPLDPAGNCLVELDYKAGITVNTNINAAGTPQASINTNPN